MMGRLLRSAGTFTVQRRVAVPAPTAWAMLARPGYLEDCHPFCARCSVHEWPGVGAWDTVHYHNGNAVHREFIRWVEGEGYTVNVRTMDETIVAEVDFSVAETADVSACTMATAVRLPSRGPVADLAAVVLWKTRIEADARFYFSAVLKGFEYFLTTGEPVRREQFGAFRDFLR